MKLIERLTQIYDELAVTPINYRSQEYSVYELIEKLKEEPDLLDSEIFFNDDEIYLRCEFNPNKWEDVPSFKLIPLSESERFNNDNDDDKDFSNY